MVSFRLVAAFGCVFLAALSIPAAAATPARIFYLNSYHEGYDPSDQTMRGIVETLPKSAELEKFFLDSKRQAAPAAIERNAAAALAAIRAFKPDVLIVSDDDAVKYVVVPHFKQGRIPVVFCGVNWSCEQYGLPTSNITGMLEVVPIEDTLRTMLRHYPGAQRLVVLSEDSTSERSNRELLDPLYRRLGLTPAYVMVGAFESWKKAFVDANKEADLIYLPTNGAITGWDHATARTWVSEHIRKPVFTCDDFMMPYCVLGLTKVAREQGEWAARTALAITNGMSPTAISVVENKQTRAFLNESLARRIGFKPEPALRARCEAVE